MAASVASEVSEGPVMSLMSKRLRSLRKKYNRIVQMEEGIAQGKPINKEQEEVLRSKPALVTLIDEYEKLRQPLSGAVQEELNLALQHHQVSATPTPTVVDSDNDKVKEEVQEVPEKDQIDREETIVEDLLNLLYFGCLFDIKPQIDFTSTMLTRTHERECCLTYDYVTDESTDLLSERDLDLISMLGGCLISRPVHSIQSHRNALRTCIQHAKLWLANSDQSIESEVSITYAGLREKLNKILSSDYFTTTPKMKAQVDVAAAAGKYAPSQAVPVENLVESPVPVQIEGSFVNYQQKDEEITDFHVQEETGGDQSGPEEELPKDELEYVNPVDVNSVEEEQHKPQAEADLNQRDVESKEQHYTPRRTYPNQRGRGGSGGGRRGYGNVRGGRGSRGGGGYQNGRNQYYEQPGNYYPRNYYNTRGRGGRSAGGPLYNNHGSAGHGGHGSADVELGS